MKKNIIVFSRTYSNIKTGGEKYNYYVYKHLQRNNITLKFELSEKLPNYIINNRFILNLILPIFYFVKHCNLNNYIIIQYDTQRFILVLLNILNKITKRNKILLMVHHLPSLNKPNSMLKYFCVFFEKIQINCANVIITNSLNTQDMVNKYMNDKSKRCISIKPAIEINNRLEKKKDNKIVKLLFVGSIYERKGLVFLIKALGLIKSSNIRLDIIGDMSTSLKYTENLLKLVANMKLENIIFFHGKVGEQELNEAYSNADIFILPSLWEGYGMVIEEALYYNIPIISTKVGAISEIIEDGYNGFLVQPENESELAQKIEILINDKELRQKFIKNSKSKNFSNYSWDDVGDKFLKIISEM